MLARRFPLARRVVQISLLCAWHLPGLIVPKTRPKAVRRILEALGPTFIKIGQILSNRPDLLSPELISELTNLQQNVRPFELRDPAALIERELGQPWSHIFSHIEPVPVASASIAQVHRAVLADGQVAAVKLQRPGLPALIDADIRLLKSGAKILRIVPALRCLPMLQAIDTFGEAVRAQLDFEEEARNAVRFRSHFEDHPDVVFPEPIPEASGGRLLTMRYIDGLHAVSDLPVAAIDTEQAINRALCALFKMIFVDGFVHADLHPGNIFFTAPDRVVMLDVGLVAELDADVRQQFTKFFVGMITNNGDMCADVILGTALFVPGGLDTSAFRAETRELVGKFAGRNAGDFEVAGFVAAVFELQRRNGIMSTTEFMTTIISLLVFEGIAKRLTPDLDFQKEAQNFVVSSVL